MNEEMVMDTVMDTEVVDNIECLNLTEAETGKGGLFKKLALGVFVVGGVVLVYYAKNKAKIERKRDEKAIKRLTGKGYEIYNPEVPAEENFEGENLKEEN